MKYIVHICRFLVGALFIFSGMIKLNDPLGFSYKLQEYFSEEVLNLPFLDSYALGLSVFVVILEVVLGVFLLIGYKKKFTIWMLLAMIIFFTFLTFYAAYFEVVKDCGCFGDFLKLKPWESFWKDMILLVLILVLVKGMKHIKPIFGKFTTTLLALLGFIGSLWFGYHVLMHLPTWDFRAYAVGKNISEGMIVPENAPKAIQEFTWIFNVNGENKEFVTNGSYPTVDGEYVGVETKIIEEGYDPPVKDFSIESEDEDLTSKFLAEDHVIMVVAYNLETANIEGLKHVKEFTDLAIKRGYTVIGLSASGSEAKQQIKEMYDFNFDFYLCDEKALKTVIRSNPGIVKLEKGTVIQKAHFNDVDDIILETLPNAIPNLDFSLKRQLDNIMVLDQKYRYDSEVYRENWRLQNTIDSTNLVLVEDIIKKHGYPGKSIVGEPANKTAWFVIQHSTKIPEYLDMMKEAGKKGELPFSNVAMMEDRYLMGQGKKQVYGTQGTTLNQKSENPTHIIWPIEDVENVNKRRKEAGYTNTVEENGKRMYGDDFKFKDYSLKEIKRIEKDNFWIQGLLKDIK